MQFLSFIRISDFMYDGVSELWFLNRHSIKICYAEKKKRLSHLPSKINWFINKCKVLLLCVAVKCSFFSISFLQNMNRWFMTECQTFETEVSFIVSNYFLRFLFNFFFGVGFWKLWFSRIEFPFFSPKSQIDFMPQTELE